MKIRNATMFFLVTFLGVALLEVTMRRTAYANDDCVVQTSTLEEWDLDEYLCPQAGYPQRLSYTATPWSHALELECVSVNANPSFFIRVTFEMCDDSTDSGQLRGYAYAAGPFLVS